MILEVVIKINEVFRKFSLGYFEHSLIFINIEIGLFTLPTTVCRELNALICIRQFRANYDIFFIGAC